jgi:hypothetical protein
MADIDRRKHDMDVMERVLGSARDRSGDAASRTEVVTLGNRSSLAGATTTAVQVTVGDLRRDEEAQRPARGDDRYESDRRGEHTYPDEPRREPASHRQRDALKSRLERRG